MSNLKEKSQKALKAIFKYRTEESNAIATKWEAIQLEDWPVEENWEQDIPENAVAEQENM